MLKTKSALISLMLSSKFWMTKDYANGFMADVFFNIAEDYTEIPTYQEESVEFVKSCGALSLTTHFYENDIPENSIAFHRIHGIILADESWWHFSSKQFKRDLIAADNNPNINAHFISVKSGGGEAWFLDVVNNTVKNLKKPSVFHIEKVAASAAIYLSVNGTKIFSATPNEIIGSIGTMVSFWDITGYYESLGLKHVEEYATQSDLKNKKYNDLRKGETKQYIKEELDPLAAQFIAAVKEGRPKTASLEEKHPLFRGETFLTQEAHTLGLIDGQMLMEDAILEAEKLGKSWKDEQSKLNKIFNL